MSDNTTPAATTAAPAGPLFGLGRIVTTPGIMALELAPPILAGLIRRHTAGEWDMEADDTQRTMDAIQAGDRVFGAFQLDDQTRIWIITEHDRSSTCILLPEEY